ncbi:hypothetical protein [Mycolicibacterium sp.]|uniref:hypothetical protein n=1 Tax=Mycolicibacterium sp. TaxID=2320850 RepID=UPI001A2888CA|nr:hypothetical protein [Mycolicibacterium sp.]MBJ7340689.1 hypothetical protein [Mycolicibacterium sp.]
MTGTIRSRLGRVLCWGIPLFVGFSLACAWVAAGGFFAPGHDAYGEVPIPGERVVTLPAGPARLYVQERGYFGKNEEVNIPSGIAAIVRPVGGGAPLVLRSTTHGAVTTTERESWTTYAAFDAPAAGAYRVTVLDPGHHGDASHTVTVGKGPWAPVAPWVFGLGILFVAMGIGFLADRILLRAASRTGVTA